MANYRITNRSANHRRKIDGNWRSFRFGDEIELSDEQFRSGKYSHLKLEPVFDTAAKETQEPDLKAPVEGTGTGQGGNGSSTTPVNQDDNGGDNELDQEGIKALLEEVKESKVDDGTFAVARQKVIDADLFEADTLPETKKGVIEALEDLIEE
jgi:hypothetical protein